MSAIFENKPPAQEDVIGALSLIIWSITLVVLTLQLQVTRQAAGRCRCPQSP